MRDAAFHEQLQRYVAWLSVGASTVRGQKRPGLVRHCRDALAKIDLRRFAVGQETTFRKRLDEATAAFQRDLPAGCRHWGLARKVLNIFLRCALYNAYLRERFQLETAERLLELPLDRLTADGLRRDSPTGTLPRWGGVKHLAPEDSTRFQNRALELAEEQGIARVHLDITLWLQRD